MRNVGAQACTGPKATKKYYSQVLEQHSKHTHTRTARRRSSLVLSKVTHELCVHYVYAAWPAAN